MAISGLLYDIALLGFITCLMLTYEDSIVKLVIFADDDIMTVLFMISTTTIILANIHVLILLNIVLFAVVLFFAIAVVIAFFLSPLLLFIYFPTVAVLGYCAVCYSSRVPVEKMDLQLKSREEEIFTNPLYSDDNTENSAIF